MSSPSSSPVAPAPSANVAPGSVLEVMRIDKMWNPDLKKWEIDQHDPLTDRTESTAAKDKYAIWSEYVFIVRQKIRQRPGADAPTILTTFLIRSQFLRDILQEVMEEFLNLNWRAPILKIEPQVILLFFHRLSAKLRSSHDGSEAGAASTQEQHLAFLLKFLESEYSALLQKIRDFIRHDTITFDLLWALFVPGDVLLTSCDITKEARAFRLRRPLKLQKEFFSEIPYWNLGCEYVEATANSISDSSSHFGLAGKSLRIDHFDGVREIADLDIYPIHHHPSIVDIKKNLVQRGKGWTELRGVRHMQYVGLAWRNNETLQLDGQIMIDMDTLRRMEPDYRLAAATQTLCGRPLNRPGVDYASQSAGHLADDLLLLATPVVHGFSLTEKRWLALNVNHVAPIQWSKEPYTQLAIDSNRKKLLHALVQSQKTVNTSFDDFVAGKGRGLVVNLFGPPGVGKTLTVEATSEYLRKPLYIVSAGDLGTSPGALDKALTKIFRLAPVWGAIVLLDEADVFLEKRSTADVERNAMVAVFLRQLEYYGGILFLTTNRVKEFDPAFQSRIHLSLHYGDLSRAAKGQLWGAFLDKTRKTGKGLQEPSAGQIEVLSRLDFNGRQIKNIVKLSGALAAHEGAPLSYQHILTTLNATEEGETRDAHWSAAGILSAGVATMGILALVVLRFRTKAQ